MGGSVQHAGSTLGKNSLHFQYNHLPAGFAPASSAAAEAAKPGIGN